MCNTDDTEALPVCVRSVPLTSGEQQDTVHSGRTFWSHNVPGLHWEVVLVVASVY